MGETMRKKYTLNGALSAKLRDAFHDPVRDYAAKLNAPQRKEFHVAVDHALRRAADYDQHATMSRAQQRQDAELKLYHDYHRQVEVSELTNVPPPPRPTYQEMASQAQEAVDGRLQAGTLRIDNEIRYSLNALCQRLTNDTQVFDETWKASEQIAELDSYLRQLKDVEQCFEPEMEEEL